MKECRFEVSKIKNAMKCPEHLKSLNISQRFWDKVKINNKNGCWEWIGSLHSTGYGWYHSKYTNGRAYQVRAHRFLYLSIHSNINPSLFICHKCDNRKCVNPDHLFAGTSHDNVSDMIIKGRKKPPSGAFEEKHPMAKLKRSDVIEIKELISRDLLSQSEIAKKFSVEQCAISQIKLKRTWKTV